MGLITEVSEMSLRVMSIRESALELKNHAWLERLRKGNVDMSGDAGRMIAEYLDVFLDAIIAERPASILDGAMSLYAYYEFPDGSVVHQPTRNGPWQVTTKNGEELGSDRNRVQEFATAGLAAVALKEIGQGPASKGVV